MRFPTLSGLNRCNHKDLKVFLLSHASAFTSHTVAKRAKHVVIDTLT